MSDGAKPPQRPKRLAPDELAREIAKLLKRDGGAHRRRVPRLDMLNAGRVLIVLGILALGLGVVQAAAWVGDLIGFEATGTVTRGTPVFACPGEPQFGALFNGEAVQVIGRTEDGLWLAVRDTRAPGNVAFADATRITVEDDEISRLPIRSCEPMILAGSVSTTTSTPGTSVSAPSTTTAGDTSTTATTPEPTTVGPPPRRGTSSPGTTTTTTTTTSTTPGSSSTSTSSSTSVPSSSTTSLPTTTTPTTSPTTTTPSTTSTTPTTSTTTPTTTTTTAPATTTTTEPPTTTTTTTEPPTTTTTTEPTTTTTG